MPTKKRSNPDHNTPPKGKDKKNKNDDEDELCIICDQTIQEASEEQVGEEAIFCEGLCKGWLHRKCTGLSNICFNKLSKSNNKFLRVYCRLSEQISLVEELRDEIKSLKAKLSDSPVSTNPVPEGQRSTESIQSKSIPDKSSCISPTQADNSNSPDRKFNVVIYGVKENPANTPRATRSKTDIASCVEILTQTNNEITHHSIRDCFRLGKFKSSNARPRPILVKLTRSFDANAVLYNRSKAPSGTQIKPDMNREERKKESLLLSEQWNLICSGIDKKDIKIYGSKLFVKGQKYGEIINSVFVQSKISNDTSNSPMETSSSSNNNTTAKSDDHSI